MDVDERSEEATTPYGSEEEEDTPQHPDDDEENDDDDDDRSSTPTKPSFHILTTSQLERWITLNNQIDVGGAGNSVWTVSSAKHGNGVRNLMHYHDLNTFWQSDGALPHVIRIRLSQLTPVEAIALYVNSGVDQSYSPRVIKVKAGTHEGDMTEVARADIGAGQECGWVLMELGDRADDDSRPPHTIKKDDAGQAPLNKKERGVSTNNSSVVAVREPGKGGEAAKPFLYSEVAAVLGHPATAAASSAAALSHSSFVDATRTVADRWLWCTMMDVCICENQFNGRDCHLRGICLTGPRYEELEKGQYDDGVRWMDYTAAEAAAAAAASVKAALSGGTRATEPTGEHGNNSRAHQDWLLR